MNKILINILKPYSSILFLNNKIAGAIILAITFINPSVAISGIFAVIFTVLFTKLLDMKDEYLSQGFYIYNSLLVGMGIGFIFLPSVTSVVLIAIVSAFTFMFSFMLNTLFSTYKIPILSLPFSIVTIFVYLASLKYSSLLSTLINNSILYDINLPLIISGFFKSFGTIFFLPNNIAGILLLLIVLYFSRIIFIMAIIGFYFGVTFHSFLIGSFEQALYNPYAFNYILTAIALGGIFLLPTIRNLLLSLIGVAISVVLTDATTILFNYYAIPVFTIPFNLTVITFIFILSIIYYKEFNYNIKETPEKSLSLYLSNIFRFGEVFTKISLPFSGTWSIYQGFDDEWTHKGEYKYAYDFIKLKDGKSYINDGNYCTDYYCFGESILAPVSGYIIDARADLIDNQIGDIDRVNNWGNYIIIKSDFGFFVKICHIMQYSLSVKIGDYVKSNQTIAKCGNSGYSPQPHIHIQVQYLGVLGGFTKEFCFKEYYEDNKLIFNNIPLKNSEISSVIVDKSVSSRLDFILDDSFKYQVFEDEKLKDTVEFIIKMNELSEFYFEDKEKNKLFFYSDDTQFYFYNYSGKESYLKWLFILSPRFPFINKNNILFDDYLPMNLIKNKLPIMGIELLSIINKEYSKMQRKYEYINNSIKSDEGKVELELFNKGFKSIEYKNIKLQRFFG
jgi:urea transporter/murein DD-endopeptidase MepM/ murein hydrolase activator NlpD